MLLGYAVIFCLAFTVAVLTAPLVRSLALRAGAIDRPDGRRKIHSKPMPRLGGLVILAAVVAAAGGYFLLNRSVTNLIFTTPGKIAGFVAGCVMILGLGIYDDINPVRPRVKLFFQTLVVAVCFASGLRIDVPVITQPYVAAVVSFGVTWFWIVACANSMNLVDGIDGLASGVAFFAGAVIFVVAAVHMKFAVALAAAAMLGSVVGFLMYNWHPAVMFLGDSGSLLLGYFVAVLAMAGSIKSHTAVALLVPILALGLPIMDTLLAILRRISRRLPVSQADREHIHHRLLAMGLSSREAVLVLYTACVTLAAGALVVASADFLILAVFIVGLLCLGALLGVEFFGARDLAAFVRSVFNSLSGRAAVAVSPERTTLFWLENSLTYTDVSLALEPWLRSLGLSSAFIRAGDPAGWVLARIDVAGNPASAGSLECPIFLSSGRKLTLTLEGVGDRAVEVSQPVLEALGRTLDRFDKQGIRDARVATAAPRVSRQFAAL